MHTSSFFSVPMSNNSPINFQQKTQEVLNDIAKMYGKTFETVRTRYDECGILDARFICVPRYREALLDFFVWTDADKDYVAFRRRLKEHTSYSDYRSNGMFGLCGYVVGKTKGIPPNKRHSIMQRMYEKHLPLIPRDMGYWESWGSPRSRDRIMKMMEFFDTMINNGELRSRSADMDKALFDWEDDRKWLKNTYYDGNYDFYASSMF